MHWMSFLAGFGSAFVVSTFLAVALMANIGFAVREQERADDSQDEMRV